MNKKGQLMKVIMCLRVNSNLRFYVKNQNFHNILRIFRASDSYFETIKLNEQIKYSKGRLINS
jgi:hypothetical protein